MTQTRPAASPCSISIQLNINKNIIAAFAATVSVASILHPIDRAIHLSIKHQLPLFKLSNWQRPYHGLLQTALQRSAFQTTYFVMQGEMKTHLAPAIKAQGMSDNIANFAVGMSAGCISGMLTNPLSAIKYHTLGYSCKSFMDSAVKMWQGGNIRPFMSGALTTINCSMLYGSVYEVTRQALRQQMEAPHDTPAQKKELAFMCNLTAAGIGSLFSSPFNFVRHQKFATPPQQKAPGIVPILKSACQEAAAQSPSLLGQTNFLLFKRFKLGWQTARVALTMAATQTLVDTFTQKLNNKK